MVITETDRLRIRELTLDDTPPLAEVLGDPEVMRYSLKGVHSVEQTRQYVENCIACYAINGLGPWALVEKASSALAGFCGLNPVAVDGVEEMEIGYRLARRTWGQGLASEAAAAVLAYGFDVKGLSSVVAIIDPGNRASRRVAEKIGFKAFTDTQYYGLDVRVYRLTSNEWHVGK